MIYQTKIRIVKFYSINPGSATSGWCCHGGVCDPAWANQCDSSQLYTKQQDCFDKCGACCVKGVGTGPNGMFRRVKWYIILGGFYIK